MILQHKTREASSHASRAQHEPASGLCIRRRGRRRGGLLLSSPPKIGVSGGRIHLGKMLCQLVHGTLSNRHGWNWIWSRGLGCRGSTRRDGGRAILSQQPRGTSIQSRSFVAELGKHGLLVFVQRLVTI